MSRRELFGWFRRPVLDAPAQVPRPVSKEPTPAPASEPASAPASEGDRAAAAFSLDTFYAARAADRTIPAFAIHGHTAAATTRVGLGRTGDAVTPAVEHGDAITTIAAGLVPAILAHRCLATRSFCSVCVERCPTPRAIIIELGRPRIDPVHCDGCGRCVTTCPAPVLAFALVPRAPKVSG
jgi:ferredoxin